MIYFFVCVYEAHLIQFIPNKEGKMKTHTFTRILEPGECKTSDSSDALLNVKVMNDEAIKPNKPHSETAQKYIPSSRGNPEVP